MTDGDRPDARRRQTVKTTIVGGQPPGNERPLDAVPVGLEHVLALAAAHPQFRVALAQDADAALQAAELELTPTERAIFGATPDAALRQMIQRVDAGLTTPDRRQFLERATAALTLLVGGTALLGCDSDKGKQYGKPSEPVQVRGERKYGYPHGTMGARMDHPPPMHTPPEEPSPTRPGAADTEPAEGPRPRRPDRAPPASMGARPDRERRPSPPASMGARPDRIPDPFSMSAEDMSARRPPRERLTRGIRPTRPPRRSAKPTP